MNKPPFIFNILFASVAMLAPILVCAEGPENTQRAEVLDRETQNRSGMRAHIDPETGELIGYRAPEATDARISDHVRNALSRSDEGLESVTLPDGSVRVDLQGRFRHLNAARTGSGHGPDSICVDHYSHLLAFIAASSPLKQGEGEP